MVWKIIRIILAFISSPLIFIGKYIHAADWVLSFFTLSAIFNKVNFMNWCFYAGIIIASIIIPITLIILESKLSRRNRQINNFAVQSRGFLNTLLSQGLGIDSVHLNVRFFKPIPFFCNPQLRWKAKYFKIYNVKGLYTETNEQNKLKLKVKPVPQGIVGHVYSLKKVVYDDQLGSKNQQQIETDYNFDTYLHEQLGDRKFVAGVPLLSKGNKIKAIMTVDTNENITISSQNKAFISKSLKDYAKRLHNSLHLLNN